MGVSFKTVIISSVCKKGDFISKYLEIPCPKLEIQYLTTIKLKIHIIQFL